MDAGLIVPGIPKLAPMRATFCTTVRITGCQRRTAFNLGGAHVE
jgi:hypothetical protein